jgi:hypothetical protein
MAILAGITRFGHPQEDFDAIPCQRFDVVELDETAVHEMLPPRFTISTGQGIVDRRHLAHGGVNVVGQYSRDRGTLCVCIGLNVTGWPETTGGHLHHPGVPTIHGAILHQKNRFDFATDQEGRAKQACEQAWTEKRHGIPPNSTKVLMLEGAPGQ